MIRKIVYPLTVFLAMLFTTNLMAQDDSTEVASPPQRERIPLKDRIYFGGNLGLQFGNQTYIDISPLVGYKLTEKFSAGFGVTYIYYRLKQEYTNGSQTLTYKYETNIYGGRVFARYFFIESLFAHVETELLNLEVYDPIMNTEQRKNILSPFIGGGYVQRIGDHSGIYLMLLYNINETPDSPYTNPVIRIGINIGI